MLGPSEVRSLLAAHPHGPKRALGQNFVTDPRVIDRIVEVAGVVRGSRVLEVGPGLGSLTVGLLEAGADVVALEKDPALAEVLRDVLDDGDHLGARVHQGDALEVSWRDLLVGDNWKMVSNLPYNVAVPIVLDLLASAPMVQELWVMVQLEVAQRLCAQPGGHTIGVPTVKAGWYSRSRIVMQVPPEAFTPVPKVTSAVVEMKRREPPRDDVDVLATFDLVESAYRKRRKMLRSSLGDRLRPGDFETAGIDPTARPEELSVTEWANLSAASGVGAP